VAAHLRAASHVKANNDESAYKLLFASNGANKSRDFRFRILGSGLGYNTLDLQGQTLVGSDTSVGPIKTQDAANGRVEIVRESSMQEGRLVANSGVE